MSHLTHPTHLLQSPERNGQGTPDSESPHWSAPIHVLDDDSLLNIFYLFRSESTFARIDYVGIEELDEGDWRHDEHSWYRLTQVCRRWRYLILGSASYLRVCHICTYGRPVADMLAHSSHLPIVLDYIDENHDITAGDEEGIILALQQRHRVRHIRLLMPGSNLQKLVPAIDGEFPMLESLFVELPREDHDNNTNLTLSETFQAPHLRCLVLTNIDLSPVLQILTTCVSLVTLALHEIYPPHFSPNDLLQHISLLPQLKSLMINFHDCATNTDTEQELLDAPVMTRVTFPNLRRFLYMGTNAYLEVLLSCMTTPILEVFEVCLSHQVTFSTPNLFQFMGTAKNLKLATAKFNFDDSGVNVEIYQDEGAEIGSLFLDVGCLYLDLQVSSMAQIFDGFGPVFSGVEHLAFSYETSLWSVSHNEVDPAQWHRLLRPFRNVKTLLVEDDLVGELSRCLQSDDEEVVLKLLPELKELSYSSGGYLTGDEFSGFINARRVAGRPVTLVRC